MKSNFKIVILLISMFLFGCEKYVQPSNPQLNINGRWDVVDVNVVIDKVNYDSELTILNQDQACVSSFLVSGVNKNNQLVLTQDFKNTLINRRFDIKTTQWEFDYFKLRVKDQYGDTWMNVDFPCTYCKEVTTFETDYNGEKTRYTFSGDTYGAMPSNVLKLTSQTFYTNIFVGSNRYDKAIIAHLEVTLQRF